MLHQWSAVKIAQNIREKKVSVAEVVSYFIKRIEELDPQLNSIITINSNALKTAKELDRKGLLGKPLEGVPILSKDMFCTKGLKTTAASQSLENFIPPYSATVIDRLLSAGAIILGKCNQDEFAMGHSTRTSYFGPSKNPWNTNYTPGGSSGGSASSVSAGFAPASLGTDTGGSIRQPSHFCNLVGIKPTYGRVSRYGIVAFASSLDQAGPMTKTVKDSALILNLISGKDPKDSTTSSQDVPLWHEKLSDHIKGLKIGIPKEFINNLTDSTHKSLEQAQKVFQDKGAQIIPISLPLAPYFTSVYYLISCCEASSNLSRYDGIRYGHQTSKSTNSLLEFYSQSRKEGFGSEVKRRILMGTFCLSQGYYEDYFQKAQKVRRLISQDFQKVFQKVDAILSPVTACLPPLVEEKSPDILKGYLSDMFTVASNLSGLPSMSVPVGVFDDLPCGVQLIGNTFDEQSLFNLGYALEKELQCYKYQPPLKVEK